MAKFALYQHWKGLCDQVLNHTPEGQFTVTEINEVMSLHLVKPPLPKSATFGQNAQEAEDMLKKTEGQPLTGLQI